jgi:hypothetical protein
MKSKAKNSTGKWILLLKDFTSASSQRFDFVNKG